MLGKARNKEKELCNKIKRKIRNEKGETPERCMAWKKVRNKENKEGKG